jgi:4-hydroxybenzoate polyprenyltransferase
MTEYKNNFKIQTVAFIELLRPGWWLACFFIGLTPGMLAILWHTGSLDEFFQFKTLVWSFAYWASIVGIYAFNDVVGIKEDDVVNNKRPLPSKRINKSAALTGSFIFLAIGVILWWITFTNIVSSFIQIACIVIIAIYSAVYKNNILLGLGAGLIPIGVWLALAPFNIIAVVLFFILFFWELTLDVPENLLHYDGDVKVHPHTFAITIGKEKFARIGLIFSVPVVLFSLWLFYLLEFSIVFLIFSIIAGLVLIKATTSIRDNLTPLRLGQSLGMVMLSMFLFNIGLISHSVIQSVF